MGFKYLALPAAEQRARFMKIAADCDARIEDALSHGTSSPWTLDCGLQPENKRRNRYTNVIPWDKTRVRLLPSARRPNAGVAAFNDYINASWVQLGTNRYIAAQGPLRGTVHHFWAMCFQQAQQSDAGHVAIAMVTPLVEQNMEKCARYWPSSEEPVFDFTELLAADETGPGKLSVTWVSEKEICDGSLLLTTMKLQSDSVTKIVLHFHYRDWRDTRTPPSVHPLLSLSKELSKLRAVEPKIVPVVHCSAGVGRTGTFMAIDWFATSDALTDGDSDPIYKAVDQLRQHRMMMVQTVHQYQFLYEAARVLTKTDLQM